jgi:endonuclease/exonuclease/phosphatase family metal-dependent hydrolase
MKIKLSLLLCLLGFVTICKAGNEDTLRVMTYNIRFGELASMQEIGEYIKTENPDIVMLQEVDWKTNRQRAPKQNGVPMLNELAQVTGLFGIYGKALDYSGGYYGVGLLSKYPIISSKRILLPNPENKEQRVLLEAQIELPGKQIITVLSTHLEHSSATTRLAQVSFINDYVNKINTPIILGGDLNATPNSQEISEGLSAWGKPKEEPFTSPARAPSRQIDYVMGFPSHAFSFFGTKAVTNPMSDHVPLVTNVILK